MLGDRIKTVMNERNLKQTEFAKELGISTNYTSLLVNNKKNNISDSLAKLIEEKYGYSSEWILTGEEPKFKSSLDENQKKRDLIKKIQNMSDEEIKATLAYVKVLEEMPE